MRQIVGSNFETLRNRVIREAKRDLELGFLFAEFDFEWMLRRLILCSATCPTIVIRSLLKDCYGFDKYLQAWDVCVRPFKPGWKSLSEILNIPSKTQVKKGRIGKTFLMRHLLVHGARNCIGAIPALIGMHVMLEASAQLVMFAETNGVDMFKRISPRQRKCMFCPNKGHRTSKDVSSICAHGVCGKCPFLSDVKITRRIRNGVQEQRAARGQCGLDIPLAEIKALAESYGLLNHPRICESLEAAVLK